MGESRKPAEVPKHTEIIRFTKQSIHNQLKEGSLEWKVAKLLEDRQALTGRVP